MNETEGATPAWWGNRDIMIPGQLPLETYEASQRQPGDYEAQVVQRPIAIHGLEHLGATDRGITMFRRQLRRGIRTVADGRDPDGLLRQEGRVIPTYCNDTIVPVTPAATPAADRKLLRETGWKLAHSYLEQPPFSNGQSEGETWPTRSRRCPCGSAVRGTQPRSVQRGV